MHRLTYGFVLALSTSLALAACGPVPSMGAPVATTLSAMVGPAGARLEGPAGSPLAGVRVEIPAGALSAATMVTVTPVVDDVPLPALAERVGQQFRIEAAGGAALSMPMNVTLPVDARSVEAFEQQPSDVKVWVKADGGWMLVQATSTAPASVTIAMSAFSVAAAGVRIRPLATTVCGASGSTISCRAPETSPEPPPSLLSSAACTAATGFCIDAIAAPPSSLAITHGALLSQTHLIYPISSPQGNIQFRRVALADRAVSVSNETSGTGFVPFRARFTLGFDDNEVWSGHGALGAARHRFDGPTQRFALPGEFSCGAIRVQSGNVVRVGDLAYVPMSADGSGSLVAYPGVPGPINFAQECGTVAPQPSLSTGIFVAGSTRDAIGIRTVAMAGPAPVFNRILLQPGYTRIGSMDLNPSDDRIVLFAAPSDINAPRILVARPDQTTMPVTGGLPNQLSAPAWGSDSSIWVGSGASPELFVIDPSGAISSIVLTTATGSSDIFARRLVRMPDRSMIVVMSNGAFYRVRRAAS